MNKSIDELIKEKLNSINNEMNNRRNDDYELFIKDLYLKSFFYKGQQLTVTDTYCENEYMSPLAKIDGENYKFTQKYRHNWYIVLSFSLKDKVTLRYDQFIDMTNGYEFIDTETRVKLELAYKEFMNE